MTTTKNDSKMRLGRPSETVTEFSSGSWQMDARHHVPGLTVLYHSDLERVGERALLPQLNQGGSVDLSRTEPKFSPPKSSTLRSLADPRLSRRPIRLQADRHGKICISRLDSPTSLSVDDTPTSSQEIAIEQLVEGVVLLLSGSVVLLLHWQDPWVPDDLPSYGLIGESAAMLRVRRDIRHLAPLEIPVLLRGESGTGKELVARAIHQSGPRSTRPYIPVNLAALPAALATAELFGAAQGAFTGAHRSRPGYFARAHGGTLFLDEVGDASSDLQVLLLRALESGEIQPLGQPDVRNVDVRVVAATDANLEERVRQGDFRMPLLYRLGGFTLHLPPLRQRRDDFGRLLIYLLTQELTAADAHERLHHTRNPWLPAGLVARLARYPWPGNVRQLRNVVRQLVVSYRDREVVRLETSLDHLLGHSPVIATQDQATTTAPTPSSRRPSDISEDELLIALRAERFHLQATADRLAIPRSSLYRLMERSSKVRTAAELDARDIEAALTRFGSIEAAAEALEVSAIGLRRRARVLLPNL